MGQGQNLTANVPASVRLTSLDVLRGFDMLFIMGGWQFFTSLSVWMTGGDGGWLQTQMTHVAWEGFHFIDLIAPLFLFITGVTFPFSYARQVSRGDSSRLIHGRILERAVVLFALGMLVEGFCTSGAIHYGSILARIGVAWAIAALLFVHFGQRTRLALSLALFAAFWLVMQFVPAPDFPEADVWSASGNISCWVDRAFFPLHFRASHPLYLSQGPFGTIFGVPVTVMLGMFAGEILRRTDWTGLRKTIVLAVAGLALLAFGLLAAFGLGRYSVPIVKMIWSPSFMLVAGGCSLLLLAVFYWTIDVAHVWRHTTFFRVIGLNAILIYVIQQPVNLHFTSKFLFGGLAGLCSAPVAAVVLDLGYLAVCWSLLYFLHRRGIYFKV